MHNQRAVELQVYGEREGWGFLTLACIRQQAEK